MESVDQIEWFLVKRIPFNKNLLISLHMIVVCFIFGLEKLALMILFLIYHHFIIIFERYFVS